MIPKINGMFKVMHRRAYFGTILVSPLVKVIEYFMAEGIF